jgi:carboxymethylenebutenolidase
MFRIHSPDGDFAAHISFPANTRGPGVVVLQEIFGVNANIRSVCDWFAARGFVAIAPDLFWRAEPGVELTEKDRERAFSLRGQTDDGKAADDIGATIAFLRSHEVCTGRVGVVGYCWGGMLAYLAATRYRPDAAVGYYGVGIEKKLDSVGGLACPLMLHYAELDKFAPPEVRQQIASTLTAAFPTPGRITIHEYPNCDHAFTRKGGMHYNPAAAELADLRTLDFLVRHLVA